MKCKVYSCGRVRHKGGQQNSSKCLDKELFYPGRGLRQISRTMTSFDERSGASSSEGGGEFEFRVSTYLPTSEVVFWGGVLIPNGGSSA